VINTMTPETDNTCHYLWAFARDWCLDKQVITTRLREGVSNVFFEDEQMLEAQQRGIEANPDYDFYNLNIDAGSMWTRRIVQRMIDAELGSDTGAVSDEAGHAAAAMAEVTGAANAEPLVDGGTGQAARWPAGWPGTGSSPRSASWAAGCSRRQATWQPRAPSGGGGRG
jgi:vanillate O-demethylase monooxygenase subunit